MRPDLGSDGIADHTEIQLAKDIRAARQRGEKSFYDALAQNESARQMMGVPALRVIAHELVTSIKNSISLDWMHREAARARMRVLVQRILPPDLQDAAVQNVLQSRGVVGGMGSLNRCMRTRRLMGAGSWTALGSDRRPPAIGRIAAIAYHLRSLGYTQEQIERHVSRTRNRNGSGQSVFTSDP